MEMWATNTNISEMFIYKKKLVNFLYFLYLYLGGVWFEANVNYQMRIAVIILNAYGMIYWAFGTYGFITTLQDNPSLSDLLFESEAILGVGVAPSIAFLLTYVFRNRLKAALKLIDDDWNCVFQQTTFKKLMDENLDRRRCQVKKNINGYIIVQSVVGVMYLLCRPIAAFFVRVENLRGIYYHFFVTPYKDTIDSVEEYLIIYISQFGPVVYVTILAMSVGLFVLLITEAYFEAHVLFAKYIMINSKTLTQNLEKIIENESIVYHRNNKRDAPLSEFYDADFQKQIWFTITRKHLVDYVMHQQRIYK